VRTELTYIYNNSSLNSLDFSVAGVGINAPLSDGNVNSNSVMASVYIDIPTNSRWVPYVGGGLGSTIIQNAGSQGVLGYQGTSNFTIDTSNADPLSSWGARLGARFRF